MNYLERQDARLIEQATDDAQRQSAIKRLTSTRRRAFWSGVFGCAVFFIFGVWDIFSQQLATHDIVALISFGFVAVVLICNYTKQESDLRLLKLADKLKS